MDDLISRQAALEPYRRITKTKPEGKFIFCTSIIEFLESLPSVDVSGDLVSRQYLLDEYDRQHEGPPGGARKIIEEAPAVDVPDKNVGKWMGTVCSACGESTSFSYDCKYCPKCGAKMEDSDGESD